MRDLNPNTLGGNSSSTLLKNLKPKLFVVPTIEEPKNAPTDTLEDGSRTAKTEVDSKQIDQQFSTAKKDTSDTTPTKKSEDGEYLVKKGDTVWGLLAAKGFTPAQIMSYGIPETKKLNPGLDDLNKLKIGQPLKLPELPTNEETRDAQTKSTKTKTKAVVNTPVKKPVVKKRTPQDESNFAARLARRNFKPRPGNEYNYGTPRRNANGSYTVRITCIKAADNEVVGAYKEVTIWNSKIQKDENKLP